MARIASWQIGSGVGKSGSPAAKLMTSFPCARIERTFALKLSVGEGAICFTLSANTIRIIQLGFTEIVTSRRIPLAFWLVLAGLLVVAVLLHLAIGSVYFFSPSTIFREIFLVDNESPTGAILWDIRLPRTIAALLLGANLSVVGAAFQALFRNPLADPYIVGVSSGSAVGGVLAVVLGIPFGVGMVSLAFFVGLASLFVTVAFARRQGSLVLSMLLISGVAVGSFLWAVISFLLLAAGQDANRVLFWLLGSLVGMDWTRVQILFWVTLIGGFGIWTQSRALTVFSLGEETAKTLGVPTEVLKRNVLFLGSALTATAVSCVGIVGFVGLFVPHIARRIVGSDARVLIPTCAMLGGALMLVADLLAQRLVPTSEINLGIITALIGAPFLFFVLRRHT